MHCKEKTRSSKKDRQRSHCFSEGGGEGTRDKEENEGMEWLSMEAMTVDGGVAVNM